MPPPSLGFEKFRGFRVKGFRRLKNVSLPLGAFSVLIGANGSGKTSVLDVLSLLAASAQGRLSSALSDLSGLSNVLPAGGEERLQLEIALGVNAAQDWAPGELEYSLTLKLSGIGYTIEREALSLVRGSGEPPLRLIDSHGTAIKYCPEPDKVFSPTWQHNSLETSLFQVPKTFGDVEGFRERLASLTAYHTLNVEARAPVRLPQPMRPATLPGKYGEELISCLFNLRETERHRFEALEDALQAAFPGFERLDFPPVAAGTLALAWRDHNFPQPLYMHQLSEGTLRFLWLATLLQSPGLTALTLIDEPEVSLHPELLSLLVDLLREASVRTQIVVATHSDTLIRFLKPEEVVVFDLEEDGTTKITRADELDLEEWLKDYSLGELWRLGQLGARAT